MQVRISFQTQFLEASHGSNPNDTKFLNLVNHYPTDIRWMYAEINKEQPGAADIVRKDLYQMMANSPTPLQAAQSLQGGLSSVNGMNLHRIAKSKAR